MSAHLTHEELTDKLLGVSSLTVNAHLLACPGCAHELGRLQTSIASFRGAAHSWSEKAAGLSESRSSRARSFAIKPWPAWGWILVATAMVLFLVGTAGYLRRESIAAHSTQIPAPAISTSLSQSQLDQDNQLLSQVSGELGESVPAPMQPLLVSEAASSNAVSHK